MSTENNPGTGPLPVLLRASSILQNRVRNEGLLNLMERYGKNNVAFMNLRAGLEVREIHWIDQHNKQGADTVIPSTTQSFGVDPRVQESLSKMRTDLDAFTEVEAYSLMLDGYRMSKSHLEELKLRANCRHVSDANGKNTAPETTWKFQGIASWMNNPTPDYLKQLEIAQSTFGKIMRRYPWLWLVLAVILLAVIYAFRERILEWLSGAISIMAIIVAAVVMAANWLLSAFLPKWSRLLFQHPIRILKAFAICAIGTFFIWFYKVFINPVYVEQGRLNKLR